MIEAIASRVLCAVLRLAVFALFYGTIRNWGDTSIAFAAGAAVAITLAIVPDGPFNEEAAARD